MEKMENTIPLQIKTPIAGPACKSVLAFTAGILLCGLFHTDMIVLIGILLAGICFIFGYSGNKKWGNVAAITVMFISGMFACTVQQKINHPYIPPDRFINSDVIIEGIVTGNFRFNDENTGFELKCVSLHHEGSFYPADGILPCTIYGEKIILPEGTHVIVPGKIRKQPQPLGRSGLISRGRNNVSGNSYYRLTSGANSKNLVIVEEGENLFGGIRDYLSGLMDRYPFGGHRDLLRAMTIGDKSGLSGELRNDFSTSGIAHILAVSGLHVGILLIVIRFLLSFFPVSRNTKILVTICLLFVYSGICGFRPPVLRTFIMTSMVMAGMISQRRNNIENSLFVALLIILVINPQSLYSASLQLSFASVWTIVTFYSPLFNPFRERLAGKGVLNSILKYLISIIIVSVLAFTATAPIVAAHFGSLPLLSVIVNVPAVILAMIIVASGMFSLFFIALGTIAEPVAAVISFITGLSLRILSMLADFVADIPFASIDTGRLSSFTAISILIWLFILSKKNGRDRFKKSLLYIPLLFLMFFSWSPLVFSAWIGGGQGSATFFNVGQGDSALIEYNDTRYFLVDTGVSSSAEYVIVPSLENMGIHSLDGIFISHLDSDHVGGLDYILENIEVSRIFCSESVTDSLETIYGNRVIGLAAGDSISFNEGGVLVLSPFGGDEGFKRYGISGENNNSLVLRFDMYDSRILFTGDIEEKVQRYMTLWGFRLKSSIMKVPHHGAETLSGVFTVAADPSIAVISCGLNNSYGHPAESTVKTLEENEISVLRTDREGTIVIEFPGFDILTY